MSSWTKEPWGRDPRVTMRVVADGDRGVCSTGGFFNLQRSEEVHDENLANAERIVACVNALSGVPDPAALLGEVRAALEALIPLVECLTIRDIVQAGDDAIEAVGLHPYCINEGLATGDEPAPTWKLRALLQRLPGGGE